MFSFCPLNCSKSSTSTLFENIDETFSNSAGICDNFSGFYGLQNTLVYTGNKKINILYWYSYNEKQNSTIFFYEEDKII